MTDRLDEIRARAEAATPGPWKQGDINSRGVISRFDVYSEHAGYVDVASVWNSEDRDFMAHAREDIPYLLAEVERLRSLLAVVECTDQYKNPWNQNCPDAFPNERDGWCPNCITVVKETEQIKA